MAQLRAFEDLGCISGPTLDVLKSLSFTTATPVQDATIPLFAGNKDVAVDACTGSGKTLAFVVPIIEKLRKLETKLKKHQVGAIIVSPTRELAKQIHSVASPFVASVPKLTSMMLVGGTDPAADVAALREAGANVLIGTPGRLDDIMKRCSFLDFKQLEVLVLDEADRLLEMGFKAQLDAIMARLPKQRRTGLFSATQTEAVEALTRAGLRNPVRVNVAVSAAPPPSAAAGEGKKKKKKDSKGSQEAGPPAAAGDGTQKTPSSLQIEYVVCELEEKLPQLVAFLQSHCEEKVIIYFLTCACVEYFGLLLRRAPALKGLQVSSLHGKMKQAAREATMEKFSSMPAGVLLATDLAARGLDIPDVAAILQYDPPQDPAAFVHRVGRTARMGRAGYALAYLLPSELPYVDLLRLRKVPLQQGELIAGAGPLTAWLRSEAEGDREVMEKAMRAFVSYVRGYKEHHCSFIFRLQDIKLGVLAMSFGLLRLPRMPELKKAAGGAALEGFVPSAVDPDSVRFKDKTREKQRQQVLKQRQAAAVAGQANGKQQQQQQKRQQQSQQQGPDPGVRLTAAKRRQLQQRDELAELQHDYSMLRKLKKGRISEHAFDVATGLSSDSEMEEVGTAGDLNGRGAASAEELEGAGGVAGEGSQGGGMDEQEQQQQQQQSRGQGQGGVERFEAGSHLAKQQLKKQKKKKKKKKKQLHKAQQQMTAAAGT